MNVGVQEFADRVGEARRQKATLKIRGQGSKSFYGRPCEGEVVDVSPHQGIVSYEPTELVLTGCAGTSLAAIEAALSEAGQMLPFEPPHYGEGATLGGTLACGFSGPRRPYAGAARDFVLGTQVVTGKGEALRFGGAVMKNVAGYDVSRLMVGSLGTLGIILEASLKVLPRPGAEITLVREFGSPLFWTFPFFRLPNPVPGPLLVVSSSIQTCPTLFTDRSGNRASTNIKYMDFA